ncbi:hypothetical protein TWF730_004372 [Orbilia blumenaviensis]|uniref:U-box domain-containing protein n=1 Tax=Orbilia blumenaviensis TaxID=1796055 RepID=A0AAV9TYC9_9PEZI
MATPQNTGSPDKGRFSEKADQIQQELNRERQKSVLARVYDDNKMNLIRKTLMNKAVNWYLKEAIEKGLKIRASTAQIGVKGLHSTVKGLWHLLCKLIARQRNDEATAAAEQAKLDEICSFHTLCRILAHSLGVVLGGACTAGLISAGLVTGDICQNLPVLVSAVAVFSSGAVIEAMIVKKRQMGSWRDWFRSLFNDRHIHIWAGDTLEANQNDPILQELECAISHCIVVDPVRSTLTGQLYERHEIMAWIKQHGTDPIYHQEKVTALNYVDAPVAKMWAHTLASELGAELVLG